MNYQLSPERDWIIAADCCETVQVNEMNSTDQSDWIIRALKSKDDTLTRRQEKLELIRLLRDETNSASVYARCVAIVGERQP